MYCVSCLALAIPNAGADAPISSSLSDKPRSTAYGILPLCEEDAVRALTDILEILDWFLFHLFAFVFPEQIPGCLQGVLLSPLPSL